MISWCWLSPLLVVSSALAQDAPRLALTGLDPVEMLANNEVAGSLKFELVRGGFLYRFAREQNQARFEADPERYEIQWGGACADMGPLSSGGDPARYWTWNDRIWIFASDACRKGFQRDPQRHMLAADDAPKSTDEERAAGAALLARVVQAVGGAERIDGMRSVREVFAEDVVYQGSKVRRGDSLTLRLPDAVRRESSWGERTWAWVATPTQAFRSASEEPAVPLVASQRAELWRAVAHHPLLLLRQRNDPGVSAIVREPGHLLVHCRGVTTELVVDETTGRVGELRYHGRQPDGGLVGVVTVRLDDWREVGGLTLPFRREVTFDGAVCPTATHTLTAIEVDGELPAEWFEMPAR